MSTAMKNEAEIRAEIERVTASYQHVLDCAPASLFANGPRALMQVEAGGRLDALYWVLGEKRPKYRCDEAGVDT